MKIWDKVFKNGLNKIRGIQPLKKLKWCGLFLKAVLDKFGINSGIIVSIEHERFHLKFEEIISPNSLFQSVFSWSFVIVIRRSFGL